MSVGSFTVRRAYRSDISAMHSIRLGVHENQLSDRTRVTEADYGPLLDGHGRGWVAEAQGAILGFVIVSAKDRKLWALFVDPHAEGRGVGRALHNALLAWAADSGLSSLRLTTDRGTRAERFYKAAGWRPIEPSNREEAWFEIKIDKSSFCVGGVTAEK